MMVLVPCRVIVTVTGGCDLILLDVLSDICDSRNGAVCGALLGCKLGYRKLPMNMLAAMPHKSWLDAKVVKFLQLMKAGSSA